MPLVHRKTANLHKEGNLIMNKIARRVFMVLAIMGVLFMALIAIFEIHRLYELRQNIEKIQDFAQRNDIVLKQTKDVQDRDNVLFSVKSNSDTNLAVKVSEELFNQKRPYKDYSLFAKLKKCSLENDGGIITFSANVDGECCFEGGDQECNYTFNLNGTRKRVFIPTSINEIETIKANIKSCIESAIKSIMPEDDVKKLNIKVLLYGETDVDYTKFAQEDFLYLNEKLTGAKNGAILLILFFLLYLFTLLSFIFPSRMVARAMFAGIALFISTYLTGGVAAGMFLVFAVVVLLDVFLSFTKSRFVTIATYIGFSIILDATIMKSGYVGYLFRGWSSLCFFEVLGFIQYVVSAIDFLMFAMLLDSMRYVIRNLNINPFADPEKEMVHIELASSLLPCLSKIEAKLSKYIKKSALLSPTYKISVREDLKENEYKIVKNEKVCGSKTLPSPELTDMDIDILVGLAILAKHN